MLSAQMAAMHECVSENILLSAHVQEIKDCNVVACLQCTIRQTWHVRRFVKHSTVLDMSVALQYSIQLPYTRGHRPEETCIVIQGNSAEPLRGGTSPVSAMIIML